MKDLIVTNLLLLILKFYSKSKVKREKWREGNKSNNTITKSQDQRFSKSFKKNCSVCPVCLFAMEKVAYCLSWHLFIRFILVGDLKLPKVFFFCWLA